MVNDHQKIKNKFSIWWIRKDLRLNCNFTLEKALQNSEKIIPIFICDNKLNTDININSKSYAFFYYGLKELEKSIEKYSGKLIITNSDIHSITKYIQTKFEIKSLYVQNDIEDNFINDIKQLKNHINVELVNNNLVDAQTLLNNSNKPFKVFSRFAKKFKENYKSCDFAENTVFKFAKTAIQNDNLPIPKNTFGEFTPGENEANKRFQNFKKNKIFTYHLDRDYLYKDSTSKLSPYLKYGMISVRKIYSECIKLMNQSKGVEKWIDEILWREFYIYISIHFPDSIKYEFQEKYRKFPWEKNSNYLTKWQEGETGYPIIDACMKQLKETGWMHNRGRMIVASFLTKDLFIDWREGENWFMKQLIDGDTASNIGGWQWTAGVGVDAAPYFRIFNPVLQSKKYDPKAKFITKWLPKLKNIPVKYIHEPWLSENKIYIDKLIDHQISKNKTLQNFKSFNNHNE